MGPTATNNGEQPPPLFRLASHAIRWRLLRQLAFSDRRVGELRDLVQQPQSLVSYHLRRLREGGLVVARRSTGDARDTYYTLDLTRCRDLLLESGAALHPGLLPDFVPSAPAPSPSPRESASRRVLFACTGNSVRSPIAEALTGQLSAGAVEAVSAGSDPRPLDPLAVRVMSSRGIDIAGRRPRHLSEFADRRFDYVVTVCDRVRAVCPEFPGAPEKIHWSVPPPHPSRDRRRSLADIERTAGELNLRVEFLLTSIAERSAACASG